MTWSPDRRSIVLAVAFSAAALAALGWPPLGPAVAVAALIALTLLVWDVRLTRARPPLRVERRLPARAFIGRALRVEVAITGRGRAPVVASLLEELPRDVASDDPWFEDLVVPGEAGLRFEYTVVPSVRGDRRLGPSVLFERSVLGFFRRRSSTLHEAPLVVHPDVESLLSPRALQPRKVLAALGIKAARRRGDGAEFDHLRDFVQGDDPRHCDWAASARRGKLVSRVFRHEENHRVVLAIDASRLMGGLSQGRSKLDHAIDAALVLAFSALASGDRVSLLAFDDGLRLSVGPCRKRTELGRILGEIRGVQPRAVEADYTALVRALRVRERQHALVVVLTDFVEADPETSRALALLARQHRVLVVAIRDGLFRELEPSRGDEPGPREAGAAARSPLRRLVLGDLLKEREELLGGLRRSGVQTLDLLSGEITAPVLNRYLEMRHRD